MEISSPFGCDCDQREQLDKKLGKKEFRCDATPSGRYGHQEINLILDKFDLSILDE